MRPNVKYILKTKTPLYSFGYDEDAFDGACAVFDDGVALKSAMDNHLIIEKLLKVGMNRGFTKDVVKLIQRAVTLRRSLWNKHIPKDSMVARKLWREYREIEEGLTKLGANIGEGISANLRTHIDAAMDLTEAVIVKSPYTYPELTTLGERAMKLLGDTKRAVADVLDVTSKEAGTSAEAIIRELKKYTDGTLLGAIEDGGITNSGEFLAPLDSAKKIAVGWSMKLVGVTDTNPAGAEVAVYTDATSQLAQLLM